MHIDFEASVTAAGIIAISQLLAGFYTYGSLLAYYWGTSPSFDLRHDRHLKGYLYQLSITQAVISMLPIIGLLHCLVVAVKIHYVNACGFRLKLP